MNLNDTLSLICSLVCRKKPETALARNPLSGELVIRAEASRMSSKCLIPLSVLIRKSVNSSTSVVQIVAEDH